jgi:hypothetical protein
VARPRLDRDRLGGDRPEAQPMARPRIAGS